MPEKKPAGQGDETQRVLADYRARAPEYFAAPEVIERARAIQEGAVVPPVPRHAATVVLLRDAPKGGVEAYLLRRAGSLAFAAGMYVFPGGGVDTEDARTEIRWVGPAPDEWAAPLRADAPLARALVCAAVRETFEESGVLLAGPSPTEVADVSDLGWERERVALEQHKGHLAGLLARRGLMLRADLLRPWAHWVTPEVEPRRYDTRFFVAALPAGQATREVGGEADRAIWLSPKEALARMRRRELTMLPPTAFTLAELSAYPNVVAVVAAAQRRDIAPVLPRLVVTGDEAHLLLPHDDAADVWAAKAGDARDTGDAGVTGTTGTSGTTGATAKARDPGDAGDAGDARDTPARPEPGAVAGPSSPTARGVRGSASPSPPARRAAGRAGGPEPNAARDA
ncbi:MAG: NUDIX hydrolase [Frankiaceae bacterium]